MTHHKMFQMPVDSVEFAHFWKRSLSCVKQSEEIADVCRLLCSFILQPEAETRGH